jgi:zinc protease
LDYLHNYNKNIEAVTLDKIKESFNRRLHLDKLVTVTVGGDSQPTKK